MEESLQITILISVTVVAGIAAQVLAGYFQIPSIVLQEEISIPPNRNFLSKATKRRVRSSL